MEAGRVYQNQIIKAKSPRKCPRVARRWTWWAQSLRESPTWPRRCMMLHWLWFGWVVPSVLFISISICANEYSTRPLHSTPWGNCSMRRRVIQKWNLTYKTSILSHLSSPPLLTQTTSPRTHQGHTRAKALRSYIDLLHSIIPAQHGWHSLCWSWHKAFPTSCQRGAAQLSSATPAVSAPLCWLAQIWSAQFVCSALCDVAQCSELAY